MIKKFSILKKERYLYENLSLPQKGFTLIELIIYGGMLSILLTVFVTLFGSIVDAQLDSQATSSVQQDGQYILTKLSHDIMNAESISTPSSLGSSSNTLQISNDSTLYSYSLDENNNLLITTVSESDQLNSFATEISDLQFVRRGNAGGKNSVTFSFTVTGTTQRTQGAETASYTSTATLR